MNKQEDGDKAIILVVDDDGFHIFISIIKKYSWVLLSLVI